MRSWILPAILGCTILALILALPVFWKWSYQARLLHVVPIGSTRLVYEKAWDTGLLGDNSGFEEYSFWRPLQFQGIVYTIYAYPQWDSKGRLTGYHLTTKLRVRGKSW